MSSSGTTGREYAYSQGAYNIRAKSSSGREREEERGRERATREREEHGSHTTTQYTCFIDEFNKQAFSMAT